MERMEFLPSTSWSPPHFLKSKDSLSWQHSHSPRAVGGIFQRDFPFSIPFGNLCLPPWDFSRWDSRIGIKFSRRERLELLQQHWMRSRCFPVSGEEESLLRVIPDFCSLWGKIFLMSSFGLAQLPTPKGEPGMSRQCSLSWAAKTKRSS